MSHYFYLFLAIGLTVVAQLTLKFAGNRSYKGFRIVCNAYNLSAYSLLLLVSVLLVKALQGIPLTIATAWISLTYMLVVIASVLIFKEGALPRKLVGCVLIMAGVVAFEMPFV
jgi:multidrug transporter EmrE-like cation transporter